MSTSHASFYFFRFLLTLILTLGITSIIDSKLIKLAPKHEIFPTNPYKASTLGVAGGIRKCGGPGKVVAMRYFYCNGDSPCIIPGDGINHPGEVEFIPSQDIDALGVRAMVILNETKEILVDRPLPNITVRAGQSYIWATAGSGKKELIGKQFTYRSILYGLGDNHVEICGEMDFLVVSP